MECKKCGFKNKGGSAYCTQCGKNYLMLNLEIL